MAGKFSGMVSNITGTSQLDLAVIAPRPGVPNDPAHVRVRSVAGGFVLNFDMTHAQARQLSKLLFDAACEAIRLESGDVL